MFVQLSHAKYHVLHPVFTFLFYFHAGMDLVNSSFILCESKALLILQSLLPLMVPSVSTLQLTLCEYQVADAILSNSKYNGKPFPGSLQPVDI